MLDILHRFTSVREKQADAKDEKKHLQSLLAQKLSDAPQNIFFSYLFEVCLDEGMHTMRCLSISRLMCQLQKQTEELCCSRKTQAILYWCEKGAVILLSAQLGRFTLATENLAQWTQNATHCNREVQNTRRDWGVCVPITIILSGSSWEGRCCFRNNLWFLNNLWAYISEQEIGSRHKLSLANFIYMQQKYHLQLSWDWLMLNMPSLITCVASSSVLIAHAVSPSALSGKGYTEHFIP